jgi:hypothetical protein
MSNYQTAVIAKITMMKERDGFSKKTMRWNSLKIGEAHVSEVDFYTLSPEELADAFFQITARFMRQM